METISHSDCEAVLGYLYDVVLNRCTDHTYSNELHHALVFSNTADLQLARYRCICFVTENIVLT